MGNTDESSELFSSDPSNAKSSGKTISSSSTYFSGAELPSSCGSGVAALDSYTPSSDQCGTDEVDCRPVPLLYRLESGSYRLSWPRRQEVIRHGRRHVRMVPSWARCSPPEGDESQLEVLDSALEAGLSAAVTARSVLPTADCELAVDLPAAANFTAADLTPADLLVADLASMHQPAADTTSVGLTASNPPASEVSSRQSRPQTSGDTRPDVQPRPPASLQLLLKRERSPTARKSPAKRAAVSAWNCRDDAPGKQRAAGGGSVGHASRQWCLIPQTPYLSSALRSVAVGVPGDEQVVTLQQADSAGALSGRDASNRDAFDVVVAIPDSSDAAVSMTAVSGSEVSSDAASGAVAGSGSGRAVASGVDVSSAVTGGNSSNAVLNSVLPGAVVSSAIASCSLSRSNIARCSVSCSNIASCAVSLSDIASSAVSLSNIVNYQVSPSAISASSAIVSCVVARSDNSSALVRTVGSGAGPSGAVARTGKRGINKLSLRREPASAQFVYHNGWKIDRRQRNTGLELEGLRTYVGTTPCVVMLASRQFTRPDNEQQFTIYS